jgi:hypothetical protein
MALLERNHTGPTNVFSTMSRNMGELMIDFEHQLAALP